MISRFRIGSAGYPWDVVIAIDLGSLQQGDVSVFMSRPAGSTGAGSLELHEGAFVVAGIQQNADGGYDARSWTNGVENAQSHFTSSTPTAWHQLEIVTTLAGTTLKFDGNTVATNNGGTKFDRIELNYWAGPSGVAYFDDFEANTSAAGAPEPGTCAMVVAAFAAAWAGRRAGRNQRL